MGKVVPLKGVSMEDFLLQEEEEIGEVPEASKSTLTLDMEAALRQNPILFPQFIHLSYDLVSTLEDPRGKIPFEPIRAAVDVEQFRLTNRWDRQVISNTWRSMMTRLVIHLEPDLTNRFSISSFRKGEGYTPDLKAVNLTDYVALGWAGWRTGRIPLRDLDSWVETRMRELPPAATWAHIRKDSPDGTFQLLLAHADAARVIGEWLRDLGGRVTVQDTGSRKIATVSFGKTRIRQAGDTPAEALLRTWIQKVR